MNELKQVLFQDLSSSKPATVARVVGKGVSHNSLEFFFFSDRHLPEKGVNGGCIHSGHFSCLHVHDISDTSRCIQFAIPISKAVAVPGDISRAELGQVHPWQTAV